MTTLRVSESDLTALSTVPIFRHLSRPELSALAATLTRRHYDRGEILYRQDDTPLGLFFLMKGQVKIRVNSPDRSRQVTLGWVRPVADFGSTHVLTNGKHHSDAVAMESSEVLVMKSDDLRFYLYSNPKAAMAMLESIAEKYGRTIQRFYDFGFLDVPGRLARILLQLSDNRSNFEGGAEADARVIRGLTQRELASLVGTTRESINKWVLFFERQGWIQCSRRQIRILQPDLLMERLQEI